MLETTAAGVTASAEHTTAPARFGAEYQPIIELDSGRIHGFEALARFTDRHGHALTPDTVFRALHREPKTLARLELHMKRLQITHAPPHTSLFVNLDPLAFAEETTASRALLTLLETRPDTVVEIIENNSHTEARCAETLLERLHAARLTLALDDVGVAGSLLALPLLMGVDYIKFDRSWLERVHQPRGRALLEHLIGYARDAGQKTVLEGIETEADLDLAGALRVDLVQGFLFRPQFQHARRD